MQYKKVFLFQGVGCDLQKALSVLDAEETDYIRRACTELSDITGFDLNKYISDIDSLRDTDKMYAELLITGLCDCAVFDSMIRNGIYPDYLAGYSLGLNSAFVCSGSMELKDAAVILGGVAESLKEVQNSPEKLGMSSVIGLEIDILREIINTYSLCERVVIASENNKNFAVLSGAYDDLKKIIEKCLAEGALKAFMLDVSGAFHCDMMKGYTSKYFDAVNSIAYNDSKIPVISAYDQKVIVSSDDVSKEQQKNFLEPMKWKDTIQKLENMEVREFWDMSTLAVMKKSSSLSCPDSSFKTIKSLRKIGGH